MRTLFLKHREFPRLPSDGHRLTAALQTIAEVVDHLQGTVPDYNAIGSLTDEKIALLNRLSSLLLDARVKLHEAGLLDEIAQEFLDLLEIEIQVSTIIGARRTDELNMIESVADRLREMKNG